MAGLYVHIPFCKSRCVYCGFYSTTMYEMRQKYVVALVDELRLRRSYCDQRWHTVYLGGGTPSTLDASQLEMLFCAIDCSQSKETTIECNPDDVTDEFVTMLKSLPVNRVSMGAQTFDDERLRFLRRRHSACDVAKAVERLQKAGIDNISVDLMFGFPNDTLDHWRSDVSQALSLGVQHISAYSLMYEEGTPLYNMRERGVVREADEELTRSMYYLLKDRLESAGYEHYEVSNFALPGRRALHNSSYWTGVPYMGIGAAAHSYDGTTRQWNIDDVLIYINKVENNELPYTMERLDQYERYNDMVMLALRTREGVDMEVLSSRFGKDLSDYCLSAAGQFLTTGLLRLDGRRLRLTRDGLYVSDMIMSELMKV